jgi:quercetin dioxygenase-like cupin family protein
MMSPANLKATPSKVDSNEILDVLGPRIQFLTALSDNDDDYCLIRGTVPDGVVVPVHSHAERETFYVMGGKVQALWEDCWTTLGPGDVFDVPGTIEHAWRNISGGSVSLLFVVPMRLGRFFREIGRPLAAVEPGAPKPDDLQRFVEIADAYGYWLGSPADNDAVGISFG